MYIYIYICIIIIIVIKTIYSDGVMRMGYCTWPFADGFFPTIYTVSHWVWFMIGLITQERQTENVCHGQYKNHGIHGLGYYTIHTIYPITSNNGIIMAYYIIMGLIMVLKMGLPMVINDHVISHLVVIWPSRQHGYYQQRIDEIQLLAMGDNDVQDQQELWYGLGWGFWFCWWWMIVNYG